MDDRTREELGRRMHDATRRAERAFEQVGEWYLLRRLKPFCDRHRLNLLSGNGDNLLIAPRAKDQQGRPEGRVLYHYEINSSEFALELEAIETELARSLGGVWLGCYVGDYVPECNRGLK